MNTETEFLRSIAEEIAARQLPDIINEPQADHRLLVEARRLEKAIITTLRAIDNFTQRDTYHNDTLGKLVEICDLLFEPHQRISPNVKVILELLSAIRKVLPGEISPLLPLSKAFVHTQHDVKKAEWQIYEETMLKHEIDQELIKIAAVPFQRFMDNKEKLYWGDFTWLKGYSAKLDALDFDYADCNSKTEALMSLLIGRDFNDDRFYVYCKKYIQARTTAIAGKRDRLLELAQCQKLVLQDTQEGMPSFDIHANPVSARLIKLIKEEMDFVGTYEPELPFVKLGFRFYKYTVAFFFKLLHEQKVFGDISFRELSEQVASTCTAMGEDIPPNSITKKAYPYKQVEFKRMEALLLAMLEYLRRFM
jgi:hypothetical protein